MRHFCDLNHWCEGRTKYKQSKAAYNILTVLKNCPLMSKSQLRSEGEERVKKKKQHREECDRALGARLLFCRALPLCNSFQQKATVNNGALLSDWLCFIALKHTTDCRSCLHHISALCIHIPHSISCSCKSSLLLESDFSIASSRMCYNWVHLKYLPYAPLIFRTSGKFLLLFLGFF